MPGEPGSSESSEPSCSYSLSGSNCSLSGSNCSLSRSSPRGSCQSSKPDKLSSRAARSKSAREIRDETDSATCSFRRAVGCGGAAACIVEGCNLGESGLGERDLGEYGLGGCCFVMGAALRGEEARAGSHADTCEGSETGITNGRARGGAVGGRIQWVSSSQPPAKFDGLSFREKRHETHETRTHS